MYINALLSLDMLCETFFKHRPLAPEATDKIMNASNGALSFAHTNEHHNDELKNWRESQMLSFVNE